MILVLTVASLAMVSMQSCKKKEAPKPPVQETINAQLQTNEARTFVLPKNKRDDAYEIKLNPLHATISQLGTDASGNSIYQYTPVLDFTGNDQVVVSNAEELKEPCHHRHHGILPPPHPHGDCNGGEEDHYIIKIIFTIGSTTTSTTTH